MRIGMKLCVTTEIMEDLAHGDLITTINTNRLLCGYVGKWLEVM